MLRRMANATRRDTSSHPDFKLIRRPMRELDLRGGYATQSQAEEGTNGRCTSATVHPCTQCPRQPTQKPTITQIGRRTVGAWKFDSLRRACQSSWSGLLARGSTLADAQVPVARAFKGSEARLQFVLYCARHLAPAIDLESWQYQAHWFLTHNLSWSAGASNDLRAQGLAERHPSISCFSHAGSTQAQRPSDAMPVPCNRPGSKSLRPHSNHSTSGPVTFYILYVLYTHIHIHIRIHR